MLYPEISLVCILMNFVTPHTFKNRPGAMKNVLGKILMEQDAHKEEISYQSKSTKLCESHHEQMVLL